MESEERVIDYCSYCGLRKVIVVDLGDYAMLCKRCAVDIEENDPDLG